MQMTLHEVVSQLHDYMNAEANSISEDELLGDREPLLFAFDFFGQPVTLKFADGGNYREPFGQRALSIAAFPCLPTNVDEAMPMRSSSFYPTDPALQVVPSLIQRGICNYFQNKIVRNNEPDFELDVILDGIHIDDDTIESITDDEISVFGDSIHGRAFGCDFSVERLDQPDWEFTENDEYNYEMYVCRVNGTVVERAYTGSNHNHDQEIVEQLGTNILNPQAYPFLADELMFYE